VVTIIDGFKEKEKLRERKNLVHKLAVSIFGDKRVSCTGNSRVYDTMSIYHEDGIGGVAKVDSLSNSIEVYEKKYYQDCLRLAIECEKMLSEKFTLRTEYEN
jgi:hypothetical protein